ncbi:hypothetical protein SESBI_18158 [Sesbania bispinosa]|nr:hypothetical protein SESBI_18158 [Sesbania bispinosa]
MIQNQLWRIQFVMCPSVLAEDVEAMGLFHSVQPNKEEAPKRKRGRPKKKLSTQKVSVSNTDLDQLETEPYVDMEERDQLAIGKVQDSLNLFLRRRPLKYRHSLASQAFHLRRVPPFVVGVRSVFASRYLWLVRPCPSTSGAFLPSSPAQGESVVSSLFIMPFCRSFSIIA